MAARLLPLAALALALAGCDRAGSPLGPDLVAEARVGARVFTVNSFDGTADVASFTFGPAGSVPALSVVEGVLGSQAQGVAVTAPAAGGYAGGFGYTRLGGFPVDGETTLNLFVRPDADDTFTLGVRLQDDDDGDGQILRGAGDAIVADDEFGVDLVIRAGGGFRRLASVPVSALSDLNPGVGNDAFDPALPAAGGNGGLVSVAFLLLETPGGAALQFAVDEITFNSGDTSPALTATPGALDFSARAGQTSAPQTVTVEFSNLDAFPTATVPDGFEATRTAQTGTPAEGSQTYAVTFVAPDAPGTTAGTLAFAASGAAASVALSGTATAGAGEARVYASFEDADFSGVILFSQTNAGVGVEGVDGAPEAGGETALRFALDPSAAGTFAGFVVPPQGGAPFDAAGLGFFSFYLRTDVVAANTPLTLEVNLHEDADGNGAFDGAVDDEFQATVTVQPGAGWTLVTIPVSAFADDNSVFVGANNGFDYSRLFEVVYAVAGPTGPAYTLDLDALRFTEFAP